MSTKVCFGNCDAGAETMNEEKQPNEKKSSTRKRMNFIQKELCVKLVLFDV